MTDREKESGKVSLENNRLIWKLHGKRIVDLPIDDVKLIGEFTTAMGPFVDDWFMVFYNDEFECFEISMYAEGIDKLMIEIGELLGFELPGTLLSSTEWNSSILFPNKYRGENLWDIVRIKPKSFFEKLKTLVGSYKTELELTAIAKEIISNKIVENNN